MNNFPNETTQIFLDSDDSERTTDGSYRFQIKPKLRFPLHMSSYLSLTNFQALNTANNLHTDNNVFMNSEITPGFYSIKNLTTAMQNIIKDDNMTINFDKTTLKLFS